ncbi:MAG: hypothetical protein WBX49_10390 [Candidatus Deferrimicrobiaceae bacterium]
MREVKAAMISSWLVQPPTLDGRTGLQGFQTIPMGYRIYGNGYPLVMIMGYGNAMISVCLI